MIFRTTTLRLTVFTTAVQGGPEVEAEVRPLARVRELQGKLHLRVDGAPGRPGVKPIADNISKSEESGSRA